MVQFSGMRMPAVVVLLVPHGFSLTMVTRAVDDAVRATATMRLAGLPLGARMCLSERGPHSKRMEDR